MPALCKTAQYSFIPSSMMKFVASLFGQEMIMSHEPASSSAPTKILVPLDFSSSSAAALSMATALAQRFGAEVHLLHVVPMLPVINGVDDFPQMQMPLENRFIDESQERAKQRLETYVAPLLALRVKVEYSAEAGTDVVDNILTAIESQSIDMLVISTHGISGWRPLVFGSIAEKLIRLVQCPLVLLRSREPLETLPA
jgi:nucleotide-binding universal stress UspA family protein